MSSIEPTEYGDQVDAGKEVSGKLFIARGDAPELFEFVEEPLDQVAFGVERKVAAAGRLAVRLGRDDGGNAGGYETVDEGVGVVSFVGNEGLRCSLGDQLRGGNQVVDLAWGEPQDERIAQSIDESMDLGAQASSGSSDGLALAPFFGAPALC